MILEKICEYDKIIIQCHDNPDADALASGFGMYEYLKSKGKDVRFVYSGMFKMQKSNLVLMVDSLGINVEYVEPEEAAKMHLGADECLVTVDCQYGEGNVTRILADNYFVIDHHQIAGECPDNYLVLSGYGSCSTVVWELLMQEGIEINEFKEGLSTALYYGLFTDTNQFAEIFNVKDKDCRDYLEYDRKLVHTMCNSNLSLSEMAIAGQAMLGNVYNEEYKYSIVKAMPCDPNILGLISDFLLQVNEVNNCVVYNENREGVKLSVRSCIREVNASELAGFLTEGVGSGGGHLEKAGGFIQWKMYKNLYGDKDITQYFIDRLEEYYKKFELIYAEEHEVDVAKMTLYKKNKLPIGYVKMSEMMPVGTPITVRTLEGDNDLTITDDLYVMIGINGEVYPNKEEKFLRGNKLLDTPYVYEDMVLEAKYVPTVKNRNTGRTLQLTDYARTCIPSGEVLIYAKQVDTDVKVFTTWDKDRYMRGKKGDYLAARNDDLHDIYIIEEKIFYKTYTEV